MKSAKIKKVCLCGNLIDRFSPDREFCSIQCHLKSHYANASGARLKDKKLNGDRLGK
jgi:hypothetical protein